MGWHILRLEVDVEFPGGAAPGAGRDGNAAFLARDGQGRAILRGSALAGVLRSSWSRAFGRSRDDARHWFGQAAESRAGTASRVVVENVVLGKADATTERRTHNAISRHTGAPTMGGLFSVESIAPGTQGRLRVAVRTADAELAEARMLIGELGTILTEGILVGGSSARGVGLMRARGSSGLAFRSFDLSAIDDHASWLDERRAGGAAPAGQRDPLPDTHASARLVIEGSLAIPRGQDLVIGGDSGLDAVIEPQRVKSADGKPMLRFPGSALRGVMRKWVARLAARDGHAVADSHAQAVRTRENAKASGRASPSATGEELGWGFIEKAARTPFQNDPSSIPCPVMRLFGSLYARGRIHVADALIGDAKRAVRHRMHVSIDRVSGGASNGFLFATQVVCPTEPIPLRITIDAPTDDEARWIAATLHAMHLGVLRVGSSKAAGRFELAKLRATGSGAQHFERLAKSGGENHG